MHMVFCFVMRVYLYITIIVFNAKWRKYQGVLKVKSRVKTLQARGIWSQQLEHKQVPKIKEIELQSIFLFYSLKVPQNNHYEWSLNLQYREHILRSRRHGRFTQHSNTNHRQQDYSTTSLVTKSTTTDETTQSYVVTTGETTQTNLATTGETTLSHLLTTLSTERFPSTTRQAINASLRSLDNTN